MKRLLGIHIILKNTLSEVKLFSLILIWIVECRADMAYAREFQVCYTSGYNKSNGVYSVADKYGVAKRCLYEESDVENELLKVEKKVVFNMSVKVFERNVYAFINIKNLASKEIYIWKGDLFSLGNELSGDFFNIISNDIRMDYHGFKVNFGAGPESTSDYIRLVPGEEINESIKLNAYYQFLPGEHQYTIGTAYVPYTYIPGTGDYYFSEETAFWIRSNRENVLIDGSKIESKLSTIYSVR